MFIYPILNVYSAPFCRFIYLILNVYSAPFFRFLLLRPPGYLFHPPCLFCSVLLVYSAPSSGLSISSSMFILLLLLVYSAPSSGLSISSSMFILLRSLGLFCSVLQVIYFILHVYSAPFFRFILLRPPVYLFYPPCLYRQGLYRFIFQVYSDLSCRLSISSSMFIQLHT